MRRLSRPQSSVSPLESTPQWSLSPVLQAAADPDQASGPSLDSATPSLLYFSAFAQECEALAFQLSKDEERVPSRRLSTIQGETLTPLEPPCSFLDSFDGRSPTRPASASTGPPVPFAAGPCSEQSAGLAGMSVGIVPQLPTTDPILGLPEVSRPELEKASPPLPSSEQSAGLAGLSVGVVVQLPATDPILGLPEVSLRPELEKASPLLSSEQSAGLAGLSVGVVAQLPATDPILGLPEVSSRPELEKALSLPSSEQSTGLAGISVGVVTQLPTTSPILGLAGLSSWPELEKASPPPREVNVTYVCNSSSSSADATRSSLLGLRITPADATSNEPTFVVCERELPFISSTPLMALSLSKDASPSASCTEWPGKRKTFGSDSKKPPADLQQQPGFQFTFASNHGRLPAAAIGKTDQVPHISSKAPLAKRKLSLGAPRALRTREASGIGGPPKGTGVTRKLPQPADGNGSQNFVMPKTRSGSALLSHPVKKKHLSDEITKTDLTELPCNKKPPISKTGLTELSCNKKSLISMQPTSKPSGRLGVQESLKCLGLKLHGAPRDNVSGTRLPVFAGSKVTAKTSSQKRPWEKPPDKATASPLKQPFPKRSRLCKSQKEKPMCSDLIAVGQTPSATLAKEPNTPCSQCQWLAEENQQLKNMLETCRKTIAFLERKQTVVENENCPPHTKCT